MPSRSRAAALAAVLLLAALAQVACGSTSGIFGKQYEYEEDLTVSLDGSATVVVNTSLAALVALRGVDIDTTPSGRMDSDRLRAAYRSPVTEVTRVSRPWRRDGRRFVQIRVEVQDIRRLHEAAPFAWSRYDLRQENGASIFTQVRLPLAQGAPPSLPITAFSGFTCGAPLPNSKGAATATRTANVLLRMIAPQCTDRLYRPDCWGSA